eukprot:762844-Hanusia_phi.AAC.1
MKGLVQGVDRADCHSTKSLRWTGDNIEVLDFEFFAGGLGRRRVAYNLVRQHVGSVQHLNHSCCWRKRIGSKSLCVQVQSGVRTRIRRTRVLWVTRVRIARRRRRGRCPVGALGGGDKRERGYEIQGCRFRLALQVGK